MKIKLDENIPFSIVEDLIELGHDTDSVFEENMCGATDDALWEEVQNNERFFITQDMDFSDLAKFLPGSHFGIMLVRLKEPGRVALKNKIKAAFTENDVSIWQGSFVVLSDHKLRVRK